jgi:hypothetical protein
VLEQSVAERIDLDLSAHLDGRGHDLAIALNQAATRFAASGGSLSGAAQMGYIEAARNELAFRADYITDAIVRAHRNIDGIYKLDLRIELRAALEAHLSAERAKILAATQPLMARNLGTELETALNREFANKIAMNGIRLEEYCDSIQRRTYTEQQNPGSTIVIASRGQQSGITAHTVNIDQNSPASTPPPQAERLPWYRSLWALISGLVILLAALTEILHYLGVAPWERHP